MHTSLNGKKMAWEFSLEKWMWTDQPLKYLSTWDRKCLLHWQPTWCRDAAGLQTLSGPATVRFGICWELCTQLVPGLLPLPYWLGWDTGYYLAPPLPQMSPVSRMSTWLSQRERCTAELSPSRLLKDHLEIAALPLSDLILFKLTIIKLLCLISRAIKWLQWMCAELW